MQSYTWPGMFKPFEHQRKTAEFLVENPRAFCFNEAGTGKTSSVIWACDHLMNQGIIKRVLIICPLSVMYSAWQSDLFKTAMHRKTAVAYGSANKRSKVIKGNYEFVIINYDGVNIVAKDIYDAAFDLIVVDEANAYKTSTTLRWKTLNRLVLPNTGLWMLTGTPASQSPIDAYGLAKLVCPSNVPKFFSAWRDRVMFPISKFKWSPRPGSKEHVFRTLQPAIRFSKAECLDLPEVMYQYRSAPMTGQQQKYYLSLKNELLIKASGEKVSAVNAAALLTKLLQISGGAVYTDAGEILEFDVSHRLRVLEEVMVETERKVIVFVPYTHTIDLVHKHLIKGGYTAEIINGEVSATERAAIFTRFQTTDHPRVLVIQPQAASHGITLTAADTVVFWSPVMSVETYIQCVARIDRVGQTHKMTVIHLEGSEIERKMYRMLENKIDLHEKLVELYSSEMEVECEFE